MKLRAFLISVVTVLLLGACIPVGLNPEQAALRAMRDSQGQGRVYEDTLQVLQSQQVGKSVFVLYSFKTREVNYDADCLWIYAVQRRALGLWAPDSGGGGCSGALPGTDPGPLAALEIGGGRSTNGPNDPGTSQSYGKVNDAAIVRVRITWDDGQADEADVINASYMIIREGQWQAARVEGLNKDGSTIFLNEPSVAPGKKP